MILEPSTKEKILIQRASFEERARIFNNRINSLKQSGLKYIVYTLVFFTSLHPFLYMTGARVSLENSFILWIVTTALIAFSVSASIMIVYQRYEINILEGGVYSLSQRLEKLEIDLERSLRGETVFVDEHEDRSVYIGSPGSLYNRL